MRRPPRLAERLLATTIRDRDWRDSITGDLREEFQIVGEQRGGAAAQWWYWRNALTIGTRNVMTQINPHRKERAWVAPPDTGYGGNWRTGFTRDFRHACRTLARRPATSLVIIVTLALVLATNTTSFATMDAIVLRPFRFPDVDRVVMVANSDPQDPFLDTESVSPADFRDWRRDTRTLTHLSAAEWWDANLSGIEQPEQVPGFKVTADFFDAMGVGMAQGREFVADEETPGNHRRVVLGYALWTRLYAADPAVIGRTVRVDGEPFEVIGVAPDGFAIPDGAQLWSPLAYTSEEWANRRSWYLRTVGRLREGVSLTDARAEFAAIGDRLRREFPETNKLPTTVETFTKGMQDPGAGMFLMTVLAASGLLLLIACANIANLLLASGGERSQEFALRLALGGSRARLAWQLMMESFLLTSIAVVLAMPLAAAGLAATRAGLPPAIIRFVPGWRYLEVSLTVFGATALVGMIAAVVFGLLPALKTVSGDVADTLRQGARNTTAPKQRQWLRNSLAVAQVAVTLALLFGSALMLTAADRAVNGPTGFDKRGVLTARLVLPERPYAEPERRRQFINTVLDRLRTIPAVSVSALTSALPYGGGSGSREFRPAGVALQPGEVRYADYRRITPEFFDAMRIPLLAGRPLNDADRDTTQAVAVVSRSLVDRYWPNADPIGRQFSAGDSKEAVTIVGVVGDVVTDWFQQRRAPTVYRPITQDAPFAVAFVVRTVGDPLSVAGDVRRAVAAADADQPIVALQTMETLVADRTAGITLIAQMIGVVALIALVLAVMGLYSLMAYMVTRRTRELGVRLALGATRWQVIGLTSAQGLRITVVGLVIGTLAATGLGRVMESALFGVVASSVWQLMALVALVAGVSAIASYIPARRIARLDPTTALRTE
jgi:putative ABC transport system permease protein